MTSNLGSEYILEDNIDSNNLVMKELQSTFKPEFINRIDEIIIFNSLSKEVIYEILDKIISDINKRLKDKNITVTLSNEAKDFIINNSYDEKYGARPIKRYVQRNVETLIANKIIKDNISYGTNINIIIKGDKLDLE